MKRIQAVILAFFFLSAAASVAHGGQKAMAGLIIGGGTGAVVGQAVGHDVQSSLIGATVGGAVGLVIGNGLEERHVVVYDRYQPQPAHYRPPYYAPDRRWHKKHKSYRNYHRPVAPHYGRPHYRPHQPCQQWTPRHNTKRPRNGHRW